MMIAKELARFPQTCLRTDRMTAYRQWAWISTRPSATRPSKANVR